MVGAGSEAVKKIGGAGAGAASKWHDSATLALSDNLWFYASNTASKAMVR